MSLKDPASERRNSIRLSAKRVGRNGERARAKWLFIFLVQIDSGKKHSDADFD